MLECDSAFAEPSGSRTRPWKGIWRKTIEAHNKAVALITETNGEEATYLVQALEPLLAVRTIPGTLDAQQRSALRDVAVLIPFVHSHVGAEDMAAMPHLKLIATRSTGYDHIDLAAAAAKGITVSNVPGYGETAVAEYAFALLLILSRKVNRAYTHMKVGNETLEDMCGFDLYGKTLGVVGAGAIGLHVIRIATGFGMRVLAYDVQQNKLLSEVLGFRYVSLDELLAQSDVVTLHAPAIPATYHLINRESLSRMKPGAILINTARGSLVDTKALAWALDAGIIGGAGLDTVEGEEFLEHEEELLGASGVEEKLRLLVSNHMLLRHPNVVMTPHVAFNSREALRSILDITIANVRAFLADHPQNVIKS